MRITMSKNNSNSKVLQRNLLSNLVLEQLMDWIMDGKLRMGEKLNPDELATKLGVSKMPIREALNTLERMGLAESIPYMGTRLVQLTKEDVSEIYIIRKALEPLAAQEACKKINADTISELEQIQTQDAAAADRMAQIQAIIDDREAHQDVYDDSIVRQMVECIKVFPDGRLEVYFGGGYCVEERV